jgi:hypothetical protein
VCGAVCDDGDAQVDRAGGLPVAHSIQADQLLCSLSQADLQARDFSPPSVQFCLLNTVFQIGDDLNQARSGAGVQPKTRTTNARVFMFAGASVGTTAFAEFQFARVEMRLEVASFLLGGFAVLGFGSQCAPCVEEGPVGADNFLIEDRHVRLSRAQVLVAEEPGDDVDR